jgi:hypothetical protein
MQMKQIEKVNWVCKKIQTQLIGYERLKNPQMRRSLPLGHSPKIQIYSLNGNECFKSTVCKSVLVIHSYMEQLHNFVGSALRKETS